jgi:hypothetical protein
MINCKKIIVAYCVVTLLAAFGLNRWVASTWNHEPYIDSYTTTGVLTINGPDGLAEFRRFLREFAEKTGSLLTDSTDVMPPKDHRPLLFAQVRHGDIMEFSVNNIVRADQASFGIGAGDVSSAEAAVLTERMVNEMKARWPDLRSRR